MNFLYKNYNKISDIGIPSDMTYLEKFSVRLINQCAFFFICTILLGTLLGNIVKDPHPFFALTFIPFGLIPYILHHYKKYIWSEFYSLSIIPFGIFICFVLYGNNSGIQYLFTVFVLAAIPFFKKNNHRILYIFYILALYLIGIFYNKNYENILEASITEWEHYIFGVIAFHLIIWTIHTFHEATTQQAGNLEKKNKELANQNKELQISIEQNNLKTKLLSVLTHDLRGSAYTFNNLTKKVNYLIKKNEPKQLLEFGSHFEKQGEKLIHNIENLLAWITTQQEVINPEYDKFQLSKNVEQIIENLCSIADEKSISIINRIDDLVFIESDSNLLKIIIQNLIHNSIKYSPEDSKIIIDWKSTINFHNIIIIDEGKGMKQAEIDELHDDKKKINNKITNQGYGIGLSICFSFIKILKGKLIFKRGEEMGLEVTIELPKKRITKLHYPK